MAGFSKLEHQERSQRFFSWTLSSKKNWENKEDRGTCLKILSGQVKLPFRRNSKNFFLFVCVFCCVLLVLVFFPLDRVIQYSIKKVE